MVPGVYPLRARRLPSRKHPGSALSRLLTPNWLTNPATGAITGPSPFSLKEPCVQSDPERAGATLELGRASASRQAPGMMGRGGTCEHRGCRRGGGGWKSPRGSLPGYPEPRLGHRLLRRDSLAALLCPTGPPPSACRRQAGQEGSTPASAPGLPVIHNQRREACGRAWGSWIPSALFQIWPFRVFA